MQIEGIRHALSRHAEVSGLTWTRLQDGVLCNSEEMTQRCLQLILSLAIMHGLHGSSMKD